MTVIEIMAELIRHGAQLHADGENLIIRAPKGATLPDRVRLAEHKEEMLAQLRNLSTGRAFLHSLSYGQKSLWFLYQLAPDSAAYNVAYSVRIATEVNVAALEAGLQAVVDRHPCLRTTYTAIAGEPAQLVHEFGKLSFEIVQAPNWSLEEVRVQMDKEADRPFDLKRGPVLRAHLFVRSTHQYFLLITAHHIAVDAGSMDVLTQDLRKFYNREPLRPLSFQYSDYVRWQMEMLASPRGDQLWQHWQKQLSGELPVLDLPTDRRRPAVQTYRGATHSFVLNEDITRSLKEVAKYNHATLYTTVLAAFDVLLYRYTGQGDISVGSPMAGRGQAGFTGIVGYFVNPVVMRVNLSGDPRFKAFLAHVRQTVLAVFEHADYPFPLLVERLHPDRDPSRSPLFQSAFVWINYRQKSEIEEGPACTSNPSMASIDTPKLELELFGGGQRGSEFDLVMSICEEEKSLAVQWRYNTDLFEAATMARMSDHFETLLEGIVADPEQRISAIPMMTDSERRQLLVEWNESNRDYRSESCLHELIEEQVERSPATAAVVFEGSQFTYRELNIRANRLARYLRLLGVGPEVFVGLCLERSLELIIGILAVLKAGGVYVPFDPAYPKERLAFMFADAGVATLVTQHKFVAGLPAHSATVVCLDTDWNIIEGQSEENPESNISPENLAYLIYTSGSTGTPKGVMVPHRGLCNVSQEQIRQFEVKPGMRVLQFASLSFDASIFEIVMALSSGATLWMAPLDSLLPGSTLIRLLQDQAINIVTLPPSALAALPIQNLPDLRTILVAGEACPPNLVENWSSSCRFFNLYGPTETTIWASMVECFPGGGIPSIGRPIANTRIYILDRYMQPTPIGVPGELCIGGVGVARGYLNRPELTEEKFIPDPFCDQPGARIYRTGDLARYLADGNIELLGRIDHQVKVRGFRIELGEIEAILREHPALRDAVVLAREDVPGDKRLVGYVVAANPFPTTGELRSFLQRKLPDYMVPGVFVFLEALPLTPNQKVDRRALPAPDTARPELASAFVAAESGVEKTLAKIWRAVLGVERVGIHDNFFDLGGHSLLLAKVHSQLQTALGHEVAMIDLFRYSTISALAKYLSNAPQQDSLKESGDRAERQRSALQQQQIRMQTIAERRAALRRG